MGCTLPPRWGSRLWLSRLSYKVVAPLGLGRPADLLPCLSWFTSIEAVMGAGGNATAEPV